MPTVPRMSRSVSGVPAFYRPQSRPGGIAAAKNRALDQKRIFTAPRKVGRKRLKRTQKMYVD